MAPIRGSIWSQNSNTGHFKGINRPTRIQKTLVTEENFYITLSVKIFNIINCNRYFLTFCMFYFPATIFADIPNQILIKTEFWRIGSKKRSKNNDCYFFLFEVQSLFIFFWYYYYLSCLCSGPNKAYVRFKGCLHYLIRS